MSRLNTQKTKKIAIGAAIILGCVIWALIFSYVSKTENNRKISQEIKASATQPARTGTVSVTAAPVEEDRDNDTKESENSIVSAQTNTISENDNNLDKPDTAVSDKKTVNVSELLSDLSITKSDVGLDNVDNVSRDDIVSVVAPKFAATKTNEAGSYVTYKGVVYLLPDGHTAGTTWDNTKKEATNIGDEIVATKKVIAGLENGNIAGLYDDMYGGLSTEILGGIATFSDKTSNGITYSWNKDKNKCEIKGTTEGGSFCNLVNSKESIPSELKSGKTYDFTFNCIDENISLTIIPYANNIELVKESFQVRGTTRYTIPPTWNGIVIRLSVKHKEGGTSVNETVDTPAIYTVATGGVESQINTLNLITNSAQLLSKNMFPILTIIDDDAISVDQVEKFTAACESVDVRGTLACLTNCWNENPLILDALKKAEEKGHNVVIHAYSQNPGDCWSTEGYDLDECTKNLVKGMRMMQEAGFSNYKYWVTPFNMDSDEIRSLARFTGCNCRFFGGGHANTIYDPYEIDRYGIYRVGVAGRTVEELEAFVDDCYNKKGWLVFMTHFYANPEEIAEILTTVVSYAKEKGFMVATAPEAWSYRKSIYDLADMF